MFLNFFILTLVHFFLKKIIERFYNFNPKTINDKFSFRKLYYNNIKFTMLIKDSLIIAAIFNDSAKSYYIKLYLIHMYVAFINFNGRLTDFTEKNLDYSQSGLFQLKIYENYFIKHITNHFDRIFKFLIQKEEMHLLSIKFKNVYVLELSSEEIIFDLLSIVNSNKNKKIYKNEKLWQEIIYHSKNLLETYKADYGNNYNGRDLFYKFVKFECTSTYPRLTFIIKFLPVLKGISIIHMYSQKKLSRMTESTEQPPKGYREIELLHGSDIKKNSNIEFRYTEPRKLQEIEKFFFEFFMSIRVNTDIFNDKTHEIKYFDYSIITTISEIIQNKDHIDENDPFRISYIMNKINSKLHESYLNIKNNGASSSEKILKIGRNENVTSNDGYSQIERDKNNLSNFLIIKKENILDELFFNEKEKFTDSYYSYSLSQIKENLDNFNNTNNPTNSNLNSKYVEHEDGWIIKTNGLNLNNEKLLEKMNSKQEMTLLLNKSFRTDSDEYSNSVQFKFSNKISIINNGEENQDVDNSIMSIDNLIGELSEVRLQKKESRQFNKMKESVFDTLIRNKERKIPQYKQTRINPNYNLPSFNSGTITHKKQIAKKIIRKDTTPNLNNNKLTLLDGEENQNQKKSTEINFSGNTVKPIHIVKNRSSNDILIETNRLPYDIESGECKESSLSKG